MNTQNFYQPAISHAPHPFEAFSKKTTPFSKGTCIKRGHLFDIGFNQKGFLAPF